MEIRYNFKTIIVGNNNVGKSSIVKSFGDRYFDHSYHSTIGIDFSSQVIVLNDETPVKLQMWDTAGAERFRCIINNYYRDCYGIIITFDLTSYKSFKQVEQWYENAVEHTNKNRDELSIIIVGNKLDLTDKRCVPFTEVNELALKLGVDYIETSAKTGMNINKLFQDMAENIYDKINKNIIDIKLNDGIALFKIMDNNQESSFKNRFTDCCVII